MTSSRPTGVSSWLVAAVGALAGLVVFHGFGNATRGYIDTPSVFWWWGFQWFNPGSEAEHGPLLLFLAIGLLAWNLRRFSPSPELRSRALALAALAAGLVLHALGYMVQQTRLSIVALLLFAWGLLVLGGGHRWGRASAFPLVLMVFAIPVEFLDALGFHLRMGVIATTERLARWGGVEVVRSGTQLFAPDGSYQYDVAAACSGVRSLLALFSLSLLLGYLQLRSWIARGAVLLLALPLTFIGNVVRIAGVVFAGEAFGQAAGEWVHNWAGFVVFAIVLGGVQLFIHLLVRRSGHVEPAPEMLGWREAMPGGIRWSWPRALAGMIGVSLAAGLTIMFVLRLEHWIQPARAGVTLDARGEPADLPAFVGTEWIGQRAEITAAEREVLPADTGYARRTYVSVGNPRQQVLLSIVLSGRDRSSIHRPELCLGGQGWTIKGRTDQVLAHPSGGSIPAAVLVLEREFLRADGQRQVFPALFVYWFVGQDTVVTSTPARLWHTALNRLQLRPDRWGYVFAQTPVLPGETTEAALSRVQEVLDGTLADFQPVRAAAAEESGKRVELSPKPHRISGS